MSDEKNSKNSEIRQAHLNQKPDEANVASPEKEVAPEETKPEIKKQPTKRLVLLERDSKEGVKRVEDVTALESEKAQAKETGEKPSEEKTEEKPNGEPETKNEAKPKASKKEDAPSKDKKETAPHKPTGQKRRPQKNPKKGSAAVEKDPEHPKRLVLNPKAKAPRVSLEMSPDEQKKLTEDPEKLPKPEQIEEEKKAEEKLEINLKALKDKRFRRVLVISALVVMLLMFIALPVFRIQHFSSNPLRFLDESRLLTISGLQRNQHFLSGLLNVDFAKTLRGRYVKAEERIKEQIPQVRDVEVKLAFPGRIHFYVLERLPVAAIQIPDGVILMDRDGMALDVKDKVPDAVPVITGLQVKRAMIGSQVEVDLPRELSRALMILSSLVEADQSSQGELQLMPLLEEIRPASYQRVVLRLKLPESGKDLNLSCSQNVYLTNHFVWLRRVLAAGILDDRVPGTLDLSGRYQIFKPLDTGEEEPAYHWTDSLEGVGTGSENLDYAAEVFGVPAAEEPAVSEWTPEVDDEWVGDDLGYGEEIYDDGTYVDPAYDTQQEEPWGE